MREAVNINTDWHGIKTTNNLQFKQASEKPRWYQSCASRAADGSTDRPIAQVNGQTGKAADSYVGTGQMNSILSHPLLWCVLLCQLRCLQSEQRSVDPRQPAAQRQQQVHNFFQISCKHNQVNTCESLTSCRKITQNLWKFYLTTNQILYQWTRCTCPSHWFSAVPAPTFRCWPPTPGDASAPHTAPPSPAVGLLHCSSEPHTVPPGRQELKHMNTQEIEQNVGVKA